MKPILTVFLLFTTAISFSQKQNRNVYLLKNDGRYVNDSDSADYVRFVSEPDSGSTLYNVTEYYLNNKIKLAGKSATIDPPRYEGQCVRFFKSGVRQSITNYKDGKPDGEEYEFYPNGKTYLLREHPHNYDHAADYYLVIIKESYDSLGTALALNGNGLYRVYDENFKEVTEEGTIKNGKRNGILKGIDKELNARFTENYTDGELVTGTVFFGDGKTSTYTKTRETPPQFKGGLEAFGRYLVKNIHYPADAQGGHKRGRVIISFEIDENGRVDNCRVFQSLYPSVDAEALRVVQNSGPWIPATHFGRPVKAPYEVPIGFTTDE